MSMMVTPVTFIRPDRVAFPSPDSVGFASTHHSEVPISRTEFGSEIKTAQRAGTLRLMLKALFGGAVAMAAFFGGKKVLTGAVKV